MAEKGSYGTLDLQNIAKAVKGLSESIARDMKAKGVMIHHGVVGPGQVFVAPPGWIVGLAAESSSDHPHGFKRAYLPGNAFEKLDQAQSAIIAKVAFTGDQKKTFDMISDIVAVAKQQQVAV
eukprot:10551728-Alexandrium_andersonii.AAC.1